MKKISVTICKPSLNRKLHQIAELCRNCDASVYFEKDGRLVNTQSIIGLSSLGLQAGDSVTVVSFHDNEMTTVDQIVSMID